MSESPHHSPSSAPSAGGSFLGLSALGPAARPTLLELLLLLGILLLAGALRIYRLDAKSLWLDEILFAGAAQQGSLWGAYGPLAGTHAPLSLWLVRLASMAGGTEWVLRLPAMLASTLGVAAVWVLGRRMLGATVGLLAALFVALSAMHIDLAQDVSAYALLATLSTLLLWSLLRAAQRETAGAAQGAPLRGWLATWTPFVLFAVLSVYAHSYALVLVGLGVLLFPLLLAFWRNASPAGAPAAPHSSARRGLLHLLIALAVTGLLLLPLWIGQLTGGAAQSALGAEASQGAAALRLDGQTLAALWLALVTYRPNWLMDPLFFSAVALWWLVGLVWLLWRRRPLGVALLLWLLLPVPLIAWVSARAGLSLTPRRLLFLLPVFQLLVAVGVVTIARLGARLAQSMASGDSRRWLVPAIYGLVLAVSVLTFAKGSMDPVAFVYGKPKQEWRTLAAILDSQPGPRDQIIVLPSANGPLQWYLKAPAVQPGADLVDDLERLCQERDAIYLAEATNRRPLGQEDTAYLAAHFIRVPLTDLNLWYRNCRPDAWYGTGAEELFALALQPGFAQPAVKAAQQEFQALAAAAASKKIVPDQDAMTPSATPAPAAEAAATPTPTPEPIDVDALLANLLEADPESAAAQTRLGAQALRRPDAGSDGAQAGAHFQRAVELDPTAWLAYALWTEGLGSSGQITQALQIAQQGLAALPDNAALQAMQTRWQAAAEAGKLPRSSQDEAYRAAIAAGRSAARPGNSRWDEVIVTAQQAIALDPARYEAYLLLGDAYRSLGEATQALQSYQRATELAPQQGVLHSRQAEMLVRLGRIDEAAAASLNALAIDDQLWENWYALGRVYLAQALSIGQETGAGSGGSDTARHETARWAEAFLLRAQEQAPADSPAVERSLAEAREHVAGRDAHTQRRVGGRGHDDPGARRDAHAGRPRSALWQAGRRAGAVPAVGCHGQPGSGQPHGCGQCTGRAGSRRRGAGRAQRHRRGVARISLCRHSPAARCWRNRATRPARWRPIARACASRRTTPTPISPWPTRCGAPVWRPRQSARSRLAWPSNPTARARARRWTALRTGQ
ncbi:MAG: glycosyltransferase family 39 protein [Anaerolineae bacterium]